MPNTPVNPAARPARILQGTQGPRVPVSQIARNVRREELHYL